MGRAALTPRLANTNGRTNIQHRGVGGIRHNRICALTDQRKPHDTGMHTGTRGNRTPTHRTSWRHNSDQKNALFAAHFPRRTLATPWESPPGCGDTGHTLAAPPARGHRGHSWLRSKCSGDGYTLSQAPRSACHRVSSELILWSRGDGNLAGHTLGISGYQTR